MKQGLLIIDVQQDYFPGGKMPLVQPEAALRQINRLEEHFLQNDLPIIYIQHIKYDLHADFFKVCSKGAQLHPSLKATSQSIIIKKLFPNSFFKTSLEKRLKKLGVQQLVITGMMTHMCVDSTTRASCEKDLRPIVISDATATKDLAIDDKLVPAADVQAAFLSALTNFAKVVTAEEFFE